MPDSASGFVSEAGGGVASAVGTGTSPSSMITPGLGTVIGAGLGLLGGIINTGVNLWAMSKQQKATDAANAKQEAYYNREYADKRRDVAFQQADTRQQRDRQSGIDRLAAMSAFTGSQQKKFQV
ncbi:MAG: hypothetical protein PHE17_18135 [Thiothrix sp.]|nr:hypothetical protein [Thiothrix sp.]